MPRHKPYRQTMRPQGTILGDLVVDLDVEASRRRYGTERAGLRSWSFQARGEHASAKKTRGEAVRGGREPQTKKRSGPSAS